MTDKDEKEVKEMAKDIAVMIQKNIRDVTTAVTMNIDYEKKHTIIAAFAGLYAVSGYFEFKLTQLGLTPDAIQKAKDGADKYVIDVISGDLGGFSVDKGEA
jgi:ABC-type sugar transport system ATPase subunit